MDSNVLESRYAPPSNTEESAELEAKLRYDMALQPVPITTHCPVQILSVALEDSLMP
jgi:hypothetical protein